MAKLARFVIQTLWWLVILLITSIALTVRRRQPDWGHVPGRGSLTEDGHWRDHDTGKLYNGHNVNAHEAPSRRCTGRIVVSARFVVAIS